MRSLGSLTCIALLLSACDQPEDPAPPQPAPQQPPHATPKNFQRTVANMVVTELITVAIQIEMNRLADAVRNLQLPSDRNRDLFEDRVTVVDLQAAPTGPPRSTVSSLAVASRSWPIFDGAHETAVEDLDLWRPLLKRVDWFEHATFEIHSSRFLTETRTEWETRIQFHGLARMASGTWAGVHAVLTVRWRKTLAGTPGARGRWRIREWRLVSLETTETDRLPFTEVLDRALPDPATRERARTSVHQQYVLPYILDIRKKPRDRTFRMPHPYFSARSQDRHPALAVTDIDGDGFDDLYVMPRWGSNLLLRNRGDGTFEEVAAQYGLDVKDHCTAAVFADFDNDGDPDLFLGRSLARCMFLVNEGGRFTDRSRERVGGQLPYLATSVSAADYDGDGLLDIYISTYATFLIMQESLKPDDMGKITGPGPDDVPLREFLTEKDSLHLLSLKRSSQHQIFRNDFGPPNVLLHNAGGGRFENAKAPALRLFRHTYQSTWADYDGDGDPDLYCANDFAPNDLFRNDGDGRFTDVTDETGTADIGFGMGAAWSDYDNDGSQDLYVTNMYSTAGRRITAQVPGLDEALARTWRGNSLFRNRPGRFAKVSGIEPGKLHVERGGWGWGGQFVDVDNDGWVDLFALSGNYTAPPQVAIPVDT